jgi:hypothetical protein
MRTQWILNKETIQTGLVDDDLGDRKFVPVLEQEKKKTTYDLSSLNLSTFSAYDYSREEIDMTSYIIKRSFLETSRVWKYDDLVTQIRKPNFMVEYNTSLISEDSIVIALSKLLWVEGSDIIEYSGNDIFNDYSILTKLFDPLDKRILTYNRTYVITQVGAYYIMCPLTGKSIILDIDTPYVDTTSSSERKIYVLPYLENVSMMHTYDNKRMSFKKKYDSVPIEQLSEAICDYGTDFHVMFIEECISYIFNNITDTGTTKSDFHEFYFKMLYYYDILGIAIFADSVRADVYDLYEKYILPDPITSTTTTDSLYEMRNVRNNNNMISRSIAKSSCDSCPQITKELYNKAVSKSLVRFNDENKKKKNYGIVQIDQSDLPVGHFLSDDPKFYLPDKGWFSMSGYGVTHTKWIENKIIIGFNVRSKTGIHIRFKLRKPIQDIKIFEDARLIEKGAICSTKSKSFLMDLCKQLHVPIVDKKSIVNICVEVKVKLMQLEMIERTKGTNVKYFYHHFEKFM